MLENMYIIQINCYCATGSDIILIPNNADYFLLYRDISKDYISGKVALLFVARSSFRPFELTEDVKRCKDQ
jgi:hypothetical protein